MRKRLFLFALLLLSVAIARSAFAGQYYSFSSHECAVTNLGYGEVLSFNTFDKDSGGYYCADYGNNGLTLCSGDLEALSPKGLRFKGWYTKTAGWGSSGWPSVSDCSDQITDKPKITEATILSKAGEVSGLSVVFAKYIPVYDITASVSPDGSGTASVSPAQGPYEEGSTVTLSATESNDAYKFAYWKKGTKKVSGSDGDISLQITATEDAAYVAVFTLKPVVTFDANGGMTPNPESKVVTVGEKYGFLATCSRTGYAFGGWWTEKTGGTQIDSETVVTNPDAHAVYAHWTANTYTAKFSPNGGTETMQDQSFTYDVAQALPANSFKRTGYTFTGWNTSSQGTGTAYGDRETVSNLTATAGGTVYLYAQWQANTYFVRFEANGGEGTMTDQTFTYAQGQNLSPNLFTKGGYTFTGWCTVPGGVGGTTYPDGAYVNNLSEANNSIVPLYAQWAGQAFTVTFDSNGGGSPNPPSKTVNYASTYGTLAKCSRTGHSFGGWWTKKDGGIQVTALTIVELEEDQTLYAHWEATKYDIHFMPGGGTGTMADQTGIEYGTEVALSSNAFTKGIQRFRRWQGSDGKFYEDGATVSNLLDTAGVHTNTATWRNDFLVAFDGNGATNTVMAAQLIDKDELPQTLKANEYRRPGYTFLGWDDTAAQRRYVEPVTVTRALADVGATNTLKAAWSTNSYTVAFFGNGGVGEMEPQPFTYDVQQSLQANAFVRPGYDFLGWTRDPQTAVEFADQATVSNLTSAADGVVPLFAKWSSTGSLTNPYSIAADCDKTDNAGVKLELTPDKAVWCTVVSNASDAVEGGNDQYIRLDLGASAGDVHLTGTLTGTGTLTFYYKTKSLLGDDENYFTCIINGDEKIHEKGTVEEWMPHAYTKTGVGAETIEWTFHVGKDGYADGDYTLIDFIKWDPQPREALMVGVTFRLNDGTSAPDDIFTNITCEAGKAIGQLPVPVSEGRSFLGWMETPDGDATVDATWIVPNDEDGTQLYAKWSSGGEPTPGEPVEVTAAGVTEDVFALTIPTESGTDYGVWTNADLSVDSWGLMGEPQKGEGNPMEFKWTILPEFPQLFFRAHEVEYK